MTELAQKKITDAEWEVMRVVWTNGQATSREIISVLQEKMDWKQATVKTLIGRLVDKGLLATEPIGNKFIYSANVSEQESVGGATEDLLAHVCTKKVGRTIAELIERATLSHADVALLEKVIAAKKLTAVDEVKCMCTPGQCNCKQTGCLHEEEMPNGK
nr:CopY/TcrY family copper transport repressor [uncultured Trichococcus sp.]